MIFPWFDMPFHIFWFSSLKSVIIFNHKILADWRCLAEAAWQVGPSLLRVDANGLSYVPEQAEGVQT